MVEFMDWGSSTEDSLTGRNSVRSVTDAMLDMRDAPPPSLVNESFRDPMNNGELTPGTSFSTAACSSRSSLVGEATQREGNSSQTLGDLEHLLQALLVEGGFLEEDEAEGGTRPPSQHETRRTGRPSLPLYEYGNGSSLAATEHPTDSAFLTSLARGTAGPQLTLDWLLRLSQQADGESAARSGRGSVPSLGGLLSGRSFVVDSTASPSTSSLPTARTAVASSSALPSSRLVARAENSAVDEIDSLSNSRDFEVLSESGTLQPNLFPIRWEDVHFHADGDTDVETEEDVASVLDISDEASSATRLERHIGHPSSPSWGSGTGVWSTVSSARTHTSVRPASAGARSPMGLREATEIALLNGSLNSMLQRLTNTSESQLLDESLTRSVRRVLQIGTALAGERLSDEEIRALPKVRFESAEQQHCSICLEQYQDGELVTSLPCNHFFHVDCVSRWMQRATLCPLCRKPCGLEHG